MTDFNWSDVVLECWSDDLKEINTPSLHYSNLFRPFSIYQLGGLTTQTTTVEALPLLVQEWGIREE
jgi:hypothetical protein